ncbi:MAG: isoprenyl transferase [Breznakia sp.]
MVKHVAMIMDGNGRWAKKRGLERTKGHKEGAQTVRRVALEANRMGIEVLTLYAFSTENWKRPLKEVEYLCKLPALFFNRYIKELKAENIKIRYIGELDQFPKETIRVIEDAIEQTKECTGLQLVLAVNYGGRREIVLAAQNYAQDYETNQKTALDEDIFSSYLMTNEFPDVDLLIRTSGEKRLSNFLLWQLAYAEFIFVEDAWPQIDENRFHQLIDEFEKRDRRYGGLTQ